jgi:hypothetical protein
MGMLRTMTLLGVLLLPVCFGSGCREPEPSHAVNAEPSLKGKWKTAPQQAWQCDKPAPVRYEEFTFEIAQSPLPNRSVSSFSYADANVTGTVAASIRFEKSHATPVIFGRLIGAIVQHPSSGAEAAANPSAVTLKGYLVSQAQYDAWAEGKSGGLPPADAGEVELDLSGSALTGYTLAGVVRSGETCSSGSPQWSAHVTLTRE